MVIKVKVPDELAVKARERGLRLEDLVEEILAQTVQASAIRTPMIRTSQEIRVWLESLAQFSDKIPPLPETISREWIYQDHD